MLVMGPKVFATFALPPSGEAIVGRGGDGIDVKLDDAKASRRHLCLHVSEAGDIEVEDLGSANGTRVRDSRLHGPLFTRIEIATKKHDYKYDLPTKTISDY